MDLDPVILSPKVHWEMRDEERQKRIRELEIIRGILIAVLTVIITGVAIWALPA